MKIPIISELMKIKREQIFNERLAIAQRETILEELKLIKFEIKKLSKGVK